MKIRIALFAAALVGGAALAVPATSVFSEGNSGAGGAAVTAGTPLGTGFMYQGRLLENGSPATGIYDIRFILFDTEAGGAQVGDTLTKSSVAINGGTFSLQLDFGAAAFSGDQRWLEIAVRPAGSGIYSVLNPRQPIMPVPYALRAREAALTLPFAGSGTSAAGSGVFSVTQTDLGSAIIGRRTSAVATPGPAVLGANTGFGPGIQGEGATSGVRGVAGGADGAGVEGTASGATGIGGRFSGATGVIAEASPAGGTALDLREGALRVSGVVRSAFQHLVVPAGASSNLCGTNGTIVSNPLTDGDGAAILIVTTLASGASADVADVRTTTVAYSPTTTCPTSANKWVIFASGSALGTGQRFNVLVIKQ